MKRGFDVIRIRRRWKRGAARAMTRLGFPAHAVRRALGLSRAALTDLLAGNAIFSGRERAAMAREAIAYGDAGMEKA